jgi:cytochrome P450
MSISVEPAAFIAVNDPAFRADPYPDLVAAQERNWYARTEHGIWVLRYTDAFALSREPRLHSLGTDLAVRFGAAPGPFLDWFAGAIASLEGTAHKRIRTALMPLFSSRALGRMQPRIERLVAQLIDGLPATGTVDLVASVADPLALGSLCVLLDLPQHDSHRLRDWQDTLLLAFNDRFPPEDHQVDDAVVGMGDYVNEILAEQGDGGLLAQLMAGDGAASGLTRAEVHSALVTLLFAVDNVRVQIARTLLLLLQHTDQWHLLTADPTLAANAVEETMRLSPSQPMFARKVVETFSHRGITLPQGSIVSLVIIIANRDPRAYENPHRLDIRQQRAPHLSLGHGVHYCLGSALSRLQLSELLTALARRRPDLRLAIDPGDVPPDMPIDSLLCSGQRV